MLKVLFTVFPSPSSTLIYQGESVSVILTQRELAIERFVELLRDAVKQVPIRKKTRVSKWPKLRRLEEKRHRSFLKHGRSKKVPVED
jgi:hypothetical protein